MNKVVKKRNYTGTINSEPQRYEATHRALARTAASEGIVLLKNENQILPLNKDKKIALYGAGASRTIKGGTGSGDVNERESISIYQGMKNAGYEIASEEWILEYERIYKDAREAWKAEIFSKVDSKKYGDNAFFEAYTSVPFYVPVGPGIKKEDTDTAIYVLSRIAGENKDCTNEPGDYLLTSEEQIMLSDICNLYKHVVVVINAGGIVDLSFMDQYQNIEGLLYIVQPGMEGGNAFADLVSGTVSPSGKLVDSWPYHYEDIPYAEDFAFLNGNVQKEYYKEGIYVGYRYFDSFDVDVRYGFGYGLSYTDFEMNFVNISLGGKVPSVLINVEVTNVGNEFSGKEVIEVYASLPMGKLEKEARRLVGFAKTKELKPKEKQVLQIECPLYGLASYDESQSAWILEDGCYGFWIGSSLSNSTLNAAFVLDETMGISACSKACEPKEEIQELTLYAENRKLFYEKVLTAVSEGMIPVVAIQAEDMEEHLWNDPETRWYGNEEQEEMLNQEAEQILDSLDLEQMIQLVCGDPEKGQGSTLISDWVPVPGAAAETQSVAIPNGVASIALADGPAGLRLNKKYYVDKNGHVMPLPFEACVEGGFLYDQKDDLEDLTAYYQYCTAIPVGTLLAQTWNIELVHELGQMIAWEMKMFDVALWLAPGMNIHRNPLCGRNFEYYSEDPLVSGKMAAAMTKGVQSVYGCGTTIKHFACNNQETNRMSVDSIVSERALREIYLKGFEIAIRESQPMSIMTSYNRINGLHSANNYDLCTKLARKEWGFKGCIMTDWTTTEQGDDCHAAGCVKAGNDLTMPGQYSDHEDIREALKQGSISLDELKSCVFRIIRVILRTNRYE